MLWQQGHLAKMDNRKNNNWVTKFKYPIYSVKRKSLQRVEYIEDENNTAVVKKDKVSSIMDQVGSMRLEDRDEMNNVITFV